MNKASAMPSPTRYLPFLVAACLLLLIGWILKPRAQVPEASITNLEAKCNGQPRHIAFVRTPRVSVSGTENDAPVTRDVSAFCLAMVPPDNAEDPATFDGEKFCTYHFLNAAGASVKCRDYRNGKPGPVVCEKVTAAAIADWFNGSKQALCNIEDPQIRTRVSQQLHEATGATSIDNVLGAIRQGSSVSFVDQTIPLKWEDVLTDEMTFSGFGKLIYQVIDSTLKDAAPPQEAAAKIATLDQQIIDLGKEATALDRTYKERQSAWTEEDWGNMKALTRTLQQRADSLQKELDGLLAEGSPIVLSPIERTKARSMTDQIASKSTTGSLLAKYEDVFSEPVSRSWKQIIVSWIVGEEASGVSAPMVRNVFFSLSNFGLSILLFFGVVLLIRYQRRLKKDIGDEKKVYHDLFLKLQRSPTSPPEHLKDLDALLKKYKPKSKKDTSGSRRGNSGSKNGNASSTEKTTLATWLDKLNFWDRNRNGYQQREDPQSEIDRLRAFYNDFEDIREKIYVFEEIRQRPGNDTRGTDPEKLHRKRNKMEAAAQQKLARAFNVQGGSDIDVLKGIEELIGRWGAAEEKSQEMQDIVEFFSVDNTTGNRIPLAEARTVAQDTVEIAQVFLKKNPVAERAKLKQAHKIAQDTADIAKIFLGEDLTADDTRLIEAQELAQGAANIAKVFLGGNLTAGLEGLLDAQTKAKHSYDLYEVVDDWMAFAAPMPGDENGEGAWNHQDTSRTRHGESGIPDGHEFFMEDDNDEPIQIGRDDTRTQDDNDENYQIGRDDTGARGEKRKHTEIHREASRTRPAIDKPESFSQRLFKLFDKLNRIGESHLDKAPNRKHDPQDLVHEIGEKLDEDKQTLAKYDQLLEVEKRAREILSPYATTEANNVKDLAQELDQELHDTISAIDAVLSDSKDKTEEQHTEPKNTPIKRRVEQLIDNRTSVVKLVSKLSTYLNMPNGGTLRAIKEANNLLQQIDQEDDAHRQLRLRLSAALIALDQADEKVRSKGNADVIELLKLDDITTGLQTLLQKLGKMPGEKLWSIGIEDGFSQGWLHPLFRAELILETYYSTKHPLYDPVHQVAEALRQAMKVFGADLKPAVTLLKEPPKGAKMKHNADPALYEQSKIKKKVREELDAGNKEFVVDVEGFPYQVFRGEEPYGGHVVLVNPSEWLGDSGTS